MIFNVSTVERYAALIENHKRRNGNQHQPTRETRNKRKKKWNLQTLEDTNRERKKRVRLQKLQTRQSIGRLYRLHEPARTEEQISEIIVEICWWKILGIKRVHLAALLRLPHVPQQVDIILKWRLGHWALQLKREFPTITTTTKIIKVQF